MLNLSQSLLSKSRLKSQNLRFCNFTHLHRPISVTKSKNRQNSSKITSKSHKVVKSLQNVLFFTWFWRILWVILVCPLTRFVNYHGSINLLKPEFFTLSQPVSLHRTIVSFHSKWTKLGHIISFHSVFNHHLLFQFCL